MKKALTITAALLLCACSKPASSTAPQSSVQPASSIVATSSDEQPLASLYTNIYFMDENNNFLSIYEGDEGFYSSMMIEGNYYEGPFAPNGNSLTLNNETEEATVEITLEDGGILLITSDGAEYHLPAYDLNADIPEYSSEYGASGDEVVNEAVLYDEDGFKVTVKEFVFVCNLFPTLGLEIENNTGKNLYCGLLDTVLNNWNWDATLCTYDLEEGSYIEDSTPIISNGETFKCGIGFTNEYYYQICNITSFGDIRFALQGIDEESGEVVVSTPLLQVATSAADTTDYSYEPKGTTAYNKDGVKIVILGTDESAYDLNVLIYTENQTNRKIIIQAPYCKVGDQEAEVYFSAVVPSDTHSIESLGFNSEITDLSDWEISFSIDEMEYDEYDIVGNIDTSDIISFVSE